MKGMIEAYFRDNSLVNQQIQSFNEFIDYGMQRVVDRIGVIKTNVEGFEIKLGKIRVDPPRFYEIRGGPRNILPSEARMRNLTYSSPVHLEMIPVFNGIEKHVYSDVFIGEIPVMVRSKLCHLSSMTDQELIEMGEDPLDPGGYFIINGSERVLVSLEDLVPNKLMTTIEEDGTIISKVFSTRHGFRARCAIRRTKEGHWLLDFPSAPPNLPLIPVLHVLGAESQDELFENFETDILEIKNDLLYNLEIDKQRDQDPVEYLSKRLSPGQPREFRENRMWHLLDNYLLPHIGVDPSDRKKKIFYLAKMAERATLVYHKKMLPDDKDHYGNKRIKLAGDLMEDLFRYAFQFLVRDIIYQASRADVRGRRLQVHTLVRQDALTDRIMYSMATGNWVAGQTGVSQLLDRTSFIATLSHRRRVVSPLSKRHPHFKARDLHGTHYGRICPSETPEGPSCSLVKNLALFAEVSIGVDGGEVESLLKSMGVKEAE